MGVQMRVWLACAVIAVAGCVSDPVVNDPIRRSADGIVWPAPYTKVLVEVDVVEGRLPSEGVLAAMQEVVGDALLKPVRIARMSTHAVTDASSERRWTPEERNDFEVQTRDQMPDDATTAYFHVLYLNGLPDDIDAVGLGGSGSAIVFQDALRIPGRPLPPPIPADPERERAVLLHEIGHVIGLVNRGVPMVKPHEHADSPGHSSNAESVMWPGIELINPSLDGDSYSYHFDADDLADLAAYRAEGARIMARR